MLNVVGTYFGINGLYFGINKCCWSSSLSLCLPPFVYPEKHQKTSELWCHATLLLHFIWFLHDMNSLFKNNYLYLFTLSSFKFWSPCFALYTILIPPFSNWIFVTYINYQKFPTYAFVTCMAIEIPVWQIICFHIKLKREFTWTMFSCI